MPPKKGGKAPAKDDALCTKGLKKLSDVLVCVSHYE